MSRLKAFFVSLAVFMSVKWQALKDLFLVSAPSPMLPEVKAEPEVVPAAPAETPKVETPSETKSGKKGGKKTTTQKAPKTEVKKTEAKKPKAEKESKKRGRPSKK